MFGIVIDEQGYKVEFVVLNEDKTPQFYTLKDGESIVEDGWEIANGMNKPQWNGTWWIDTEPLPPVEPPVQEPNEMEILQDENKRLWDVVDMLLRDGGYIPTEVTSEEVTNESE